MTVSYIFRDHPMFRFNEQDVPKDCFTLYVEGDEIFDYLNENLTPTDIMLVTVISDGVDTTTRIVYSLREDVVIGMPDFNSMFISDDMPF